MMMIKYTRLFYEIIIMAIMMIYTLYPHSHISRYVYTLFVRTFVDAENACKRFFKIILPFHHVPSQRACCFFQQQHCHRSCIQCHDNDNNNDSSTQHRQGMRRAYFIHTHTHSSILQHTLLNFIFVSGEYLFFICFSNH